jgi:hypothetical protein
MFANGSKIKNIAYPPNTKPKYESHPSTRNTIHMYITLENGQFLLDDELILNRKKWEALQSGGIA